MSGLIRIASIQKQATIVEYGATIVNTGCRRSLQTCRNRAMPIRRQFLWCAIDGWMPCAAPGAFVWGWSSRPRESITYAGCAVWSCQPVWAGQPSVHAFSRAPGLLSRGLWLYLR